MGCACRASGATPGLARPGPGRWRGGGRDHPPQSPISQALDMCAHRQLDVQPSRYARMCASPVFRSPGRLGSRTLPFRRHPVDQKPGRSSALFCSHSIRQPSFCESDVGSCGQGHSGQRPRLVAVHGCRWANGTRKAFASFLSAAAVSTRSPLAIRPIRGLLRPVAVARAWIVNRQCWRQVRSG